MPGWLLPAALALVPPADALGQWRGIDRADNRIVFAGGLADADREAHRHLRLEDTGGQMEAYEAHWSARRWKVPVLRLRLRMLGRGEVYRSGSRESLEHNVRTHPLFRRLGFSALDAGTGESLLGPAEYLIFEADRFRCVTWRLYLNRGASDEADAIGDTLMTGLYCPRDRTVDAGVLDTLLARIGISGIAVPEAARTVLPPNPEGGLAGLVWTGDMTGLRRVAARGLDPDHEIAVSHPRFAGGRLLRRPMLMAAALRGHTEMAVFLLGLGASAGGRAAMLVGANPALADYARCGRDRGETALAQARRLGRARIVDILRAARRR